MLSFCHNTCVWQTDRRTDRQTESRQQYRAYASQSHGKNAVTCPAVTGENRWNYGKLTARPSCTELLISGTHCLYLHRYWTVSRIDLTSRVLHWNFLLLSFTLKISQQARDLHTTEDDDEEEDDIIHYHYLNSESGAAHLHETVDLVKSKPVVVVASCSSKPITIFRPGRVERHRTSSDLPLHQDPSVDGQ